jgi:hypothetical protein
MLFVIGLGAVGTANQLTYATRQAVPRHRHVIKVRKIREQLGSSLSLLDGFPRNGRTSNV